MSYCFSFYSLSLLNNASFSVSFVLFCFLSLFYVDFLFLFETGSSGWLYTHYLAKDALGLLILLLLPPKCWDFSPGSLRLFCANRCTPQCPVYVALGWDPVLRGYSEGTLSTELQPQALWT